MKKIIVLLGLIFCFAGFALKTDAYQITADVRTKRIPMGTKIELEMAKDILSNNVAQGDSFTAYLTRDVRTQTTMILPRGTVVRGSIGNIVEPKMLSRSAILYLNFDHVVAPDGSQLPIKAGLAGTYTLDDNGGIKAGGNYGTAVKENLTKSKSIITNAVQWGLSSGDDWFKGGKYLVTPFSAVGGTIGGAGYFVGSSIADLFKKGNQVCIKRGEVFNILLLEALDVPVSE